MKQQQGAYSHDGHHGREERDLWHETSSEARTCRKAARSTTAGGEVAGIHGLSEEKQGQGRSLAASS